MPLGGLSGPFRDEPVYFFALWVWRVPSVKLVVFIMTFIQGFLPFDIKRKETAGRITVILPAVSLS